MRKDAITKRKIESSNIQEHSYRSEGGETAEASSSNSFLRSRLEQEETKRQVRFLFEENEDFEYRLNPVEYQLTPEPRIMNDSWVVNLRTEMEKKKEKEKMKEVKAEVKEMKHVEKKEEKKEHKGKKK